MLVWGATGSQPSGGGYDPAADSWSSISTVGAPSGRIGHAAVWAGGRMIIWGGVGNADALGDGGRYDPATDTWLPTSTVGAPPARVNHGWASTGTRMLVWGGGDYTTNFGSGGLYDPDQDSWVIPSTVGAPSPRLLGNTVAFTGTHFIIYGDASGLANDGGAYLRLHVFRKN
jgi:hypothetical protein